MKKAILYLFLIFTTALLIIAPEKSVFYAREALALCNDVIVPSLFPFFICSSLLIYSGFCQTLAKFIGPVMKPLFNVNGAGAAAFVLGIISGYPLGAITVCQLYEKSYITNHEAQRLLAFCNNSGPLFILGAVGVSLYQSPKIGAILYLCHIISAIITGLMFRFYHKNSYIAPTSEIKLENENMSRLFSLALSNSIQSILTVSGSVIFFSVVASILLDLLPLREPFDLILSGILEFTTGVKNISISSLCVFKKLVLSSGVVGFAGLSVHLQVMSVVSKYNLSLKPYIIGKLIQSGLAMALTSLYFTLFPQATTTFSPVLPSISGAYAMNSLFVILIVLSLFFVALFGLLYLLFRNHFKKKVFKNQVI